MERRVPCRCALVVAYLGASSEPRAALEAILRLREQRPACLRLENESEASMLELQESEQQFAFKDLMIHLILQFTLHIAFRGVLHRCGNQEIHR